jgi:hypothetical protein
MTLGAPVANAALYLIEVARLSDRRSNVVRNEPHFRKPHSDAARNTCPGIRHKRPAAPTFAP